MINFLCELYSFKNLYFAYEDVKKIKTVFYWICIYVINRIISISLAQHWTNKFIYCWTNVGPMLLLRYQHRTNVGSTLVRTSYVGPMLGQCQITNCLTLGQHQANLLVERRADEQDDVGPMMKTDNGPTQFSPLGLRWPNVSLLSGTFHIMSSMPDNRDTYFCPILT